MPVRRYSRSSLPVWKGPDPYCPSGRASDKDKRRESAEGVFLVGIVTTPRTQMSLAKLKYAGALLVFVNEFVKHVNSTASSERIW